MADNSHRKSYEAAQGLGELRETVAAYYNRHLGLPYTAEQAIIGPGSKALIYALQLALDAELILPTPCWVSYAPQATLLGKQTHFIRSSAQDNYRLHLDALDEALADCGPGNKLLILNSPNNPTGQMLDETTLRALAQYCREKGIWVLSDEIYFRVSHPGEQHISISRYYPEGSFVLGGLSKHLSLGGWRLGIGLVPDTEFGKQTMRDLCVVASELWSSVAAPVQYAAISAYSGISEIEDYIAQCTHIHSVRTRFLAEQLSDAGIHCSTPQGGFYLLANFDHWGPQLAKLGVRDSAGLAHFLMQEFSLACLPGSGFGLAGTDLSLRLSSSYLDFENADDSARHLAAWRDASSAGHFINRQSHPNLYQACENFSDAADTICAA